MTLSEATKRTESILIQLIMPLERAKQYKDQGGSQDTAYCWVITDDSPNGFLSETSNIVFYEDTILPKNPARTFEWYAAPIIKTEI